MKNSIRFDIRAQFSDPTVLLSALKAKVEVPDKDLVVYLPGMRAMGDWHFSTSLGGAYRYLGKIPKGESRQIVLDGISPFLENGLPLVVTTFGSSRSAGIHEVLGQVQVDIEGFDRDTCEALSISYKSPVRATQTGALARAESEIVQTDRVKSASSIANQLARRAYFEARRRIN